MKRFLLSLLSFIFLLPVLSRADCPSKDELRTKLKDVLRGDWSIVAVKKLNELDLCAVAVKSGIRSVVFFVDEDVNYLITGNLFDLKSKKNITAELAEKYAKVSPKILKELAGLTDYTYNKGHDKYIYFISDPECPFCRRTAPILKEWAKKNNVEVRIIFFPLPIHPKAKPKAIDIICSKNKKYEDIHSDFTPKNQCEEGKRKVEKNIRYLAKLGVSGTPTLIGMNGRVIFGVPRSEEELNKLIK